MGATKLKRNSRVNSLVFIFSSWVAPTLSPGSVHTQVKVGVASSDDFLQHVAADIGELTQSACVAVLKFLSSSRDRMNGSIPLLAQSLFFTSGSGGFFIGL